MLGGMWHVYFPDGIYLGLFETRVGDDVLVLTIVAADQVDTGTVLHLDQTDSDKAWEVVIEGNYRGRPTEFTIKKLRDREAQYPHEPANVRVVTLSPA